MLSASVDFNRLRLGKFNNSSSIYESDIFCGLAFSRVRILYNARSLKRLFATILLL